MSHSAPWPGRAAGQFASVMSAFGSIKLGCNMMVLDREASLTESVSGGEKRGPRPIKRGQAQKALPARGAPASPPSGSVSRDRQDAGNRRDGLSPVLSWVLILALGR